MSDIKKTKRQAISERRLDLPILSIPRKTQPSLTMGVLTSSVPRLPSITPKPDARSALLFTDMTSSKRSLFVRGSQSMLTTPAMKQSRKMLPGGAIRDFGNASQQGGKVRNQDAWILARDVRPGLHMLGIFDGHGPHGHDISAYLKERFLSFVQESLVEDSKDALVEGLKSGFKTVSTGVRKAGVDYTYSGSTCLAVLLQGPLCICAHVGDSRAVLGRKTLTDWKTVSISTDHKPDLRDESARIIGAGGVISTSCVGSGPSTGPLRVWLRNQRIPGLAMTRSIGDAVAQRVGVISLPDVTETTLTCEHKILVVASDGLWTVMASEEVVEQVGKWYDAGTSAGRAAEWLLREALRRWERAGESDDITLQVVFFE